MDTYVVLKKFFVKYGKFVSDETGKHKTFGVIVKRNTVSEELDEASHSSIGFQSKSKTILLTMINDFIKENDIVIIENQRYRVFSCGHHIYMKKPLYQRYVIAKIDSEWRNL